MKRVFILALVLALGSAGSVHAQDKEKDKDKGEDPAHEELRTVRKEMDEAFKKRDLDGLLKHVHKNVVIIWQDGTVTRGHDGLKKFYDKMFVGDKSVVMEVTTKLETPEKSILYGNPPNVAVADGKFNDHYKLRSGMDFDMNSLFTATLIKEDGKWSIISFHASTGLFDNEVLKRAVEKATTFVIDAAVGGFVVGLLLATIVCVVVGKMRKK